MILSLDRSPCLSCPNKPIAKQCSKIDNCDILSEYQSLISGSVPNYLNHDLEVNAPLVLPSNAFNSWL